MFSKYKKGLSISLLFSYIFFANSAFAAGIMTNGLMSGITAGISGAIGFADAKNKLEIPESAGVFNGEIFSNKINSAYGANVSLGYLMENGFSPELEIGYMEIKDLNKNNLKNYLKRNISIGSVNLLYYLNLGSSIRPYAKVGLGIGRIKAMGLFTDDTEATKANKIEFENMKVKKLAYKAGAGISTTAMNAKLMLSLGYEYIGLNAVKNSDEPVSKTNIKYTAASARVENDKLGRGILFADKINNGVHTIAASVKMLIN